MAPNARSRSFVSVRSSPGSSSSPTGRGSTSILSSDQLGEERRSAPAEVDPEPFSYRRTKIREALTTPEIARPHGAAEREQRHALARVVRRRRCRIVSVVGGDEQQVVLSKQFQQTRQ